MKGFWQEVVGPKSPTHGYVAIGSIAIGSLSDLPKTGGFENSTVSSSLIQSVL